MSFLDKKRKENRTLPFVIKKIKIVSTLNGLHIRVKIPHLRKNNYKVSINNNMLCFGIMVSNANLIKRHLFKIDWNYAFIQGYLNIPSKKKLQIHSEHYSSGYLEIKLIESIKKSYSSNLKYIFNQKEIAKLSS